ncbi:protein of unknown function [Gemmobacter aquatilis]|uniref:DUF4376 domain-containing protein n=1 Tax=Gemmobacter aquatilis TaxID=933059 RepID=A0A1H8N2F3_9RHOB|nr:DUF4376 domain-containing protein [Gemmobacter aquatilis]SEO23787.1 protein of unknown function [Gemmobacter aquatilis]
MIDWTRVIPAETRNAETLAARRAAIKLRRDRAIAAGIVLDGLPVATDDVSQARLTGAALAAMLDPETCVQWKLPDGRFILLAAGQILAIARAVRAHVQACFDHEAALLAALAEGGAVDAETGWPG